MSTTVAYHADNGTARPAINVKLHIPGRDYWPDELLALPVGDDSTADTGHVVGRTLAVDLIDAAYDRVQSDFWQAAEQIATERGLGEIAQEGRSGGWLVFTDGPEPDYAPLTDFALLEHHEWLTGYRAMSEWADAWIADAPRKVRELAQSMAMDEAGESAARRMFATVR